MFFEGFCFAQTGEQQKGSFSKRGKSFNWAGTREKPFLGPWKENFFLGGWCPPNLGAASVLGGGDPPPVCPPSGGGGGGGGGTFFSKKKKKKTRGTVLGVGTQNPAGFRKLLPVLHKPANPPVAWKKKHFLGPEKKRGGPGPFFRGPGLLNPENLTLGRAGKKKTHFGLFFFFRLFSGNCPGDIPGQGLGGGGEPKFLAFFSFFFFFPPSSPSGGFLGCLERAEKYLVSLFVFGCGTNIVLFLFWPCLGGGGEGGNKKHRDDGGGCFVRGPKVGVFVRPFLRTKKRFFFPT